MIKVGGLVILGLAVMALVGRLYFELTGGESRAPSTTASETSREITELIKPSSDLEITPPLQKVSPLTGKPDPSGHTNEIVAVMIENHPMSRSQMLGLPEAGIVIEALTEGGITRFLAIFDLAELKKVGPVRSVRPYFVEWATENGGGLVHAGGSAVALEQLAATALLDFDEEENSTVLYRDFRFMLPHNLFANLAEAKKVLTSEFTRDTPLEPRFDFTSAPPTGTLVQQFALDFGLASYRVEYDFSPATNRYRRQLGGVSHTAEDGQMVEPTNVIVQFTDYWPIDDAGRLELKTRGSGVAWYFSGGRHWLGRWQKTDEQTEFLAADSQPVKLQPGQTFIEILDSPTAVTLF